MLRLTFFAAYTDLFFMYFTIKSSYALYCWSVGPTASRQTREPLIFVHFTKHGQCPYLCTALLDANGTCTTCYCFTPLLFSPNLAGIILFCFVLFVLIPVIPTLVLNDRKIHVVQEIIEQMLR